MASANFTCEDPAESDKTASSESDADEHVEDDMYVGAAIAEAEPHVEAAPLEYAADAEAVEAAAEVDPLDPFEADLAAAIAPDPVAPAPVADPLDIAEPLYDIGIQKIDVAPTGKAKCAICGDKIDRSTARVLHHPAKSVFRYLHPRCVGGIAAALKPHSKAMLEYQRGFDIGAVGPDMLKISEGLETALEQLI